jgi:uncharacterized membrane protein YqjE
MKLTITDLKYINQCLDDNEFKYQEIYDEIKDHVLLAMETARENGDERDIEFVYNDMVNTQFPGYYAFEKIAIGYEKAYNIKITKTLWANMNYYLSWQAVITIGVLLIISFYMPQNKTTSLVFMIALIIIAIVPQFYTLKKTNSIKLSKGKRSLVKQHVRYWGAVLLVFSNLLLNSIGFLGKEYRINYLNPLHFYPAVYVLLISFFLIYSLSSMRLCRQELRLGKV